MTSEDLKLSYVTRRGPPPSEFRSLRHELQWSVPVDSGTASWKRDNRAVYYNLDKAADETNAKSWMNKDGANQNQDGRAGMFSLFELYQSNNEHESRLRALTARLNSQKYSGYGVNNAKKLTSRLYDIFAEFSLMNEEKSEREKVHLFRTMLHPQGQMAHAYFVASLKQDIDRILNEARQGTPVNFSAYTGRLTSGEVEWLKEHEKAVKVSSATTAASTPDASKASTTTVDDPGYNRETGEPLKRWIHGVDVSLVYQQTHKVDEDDCKYLPNVVKTYFKNHHEKNCPPKIQAMTKPKPKSKNRRKKK